MTAHSRCPQATISYQLTWAPALYFTGRSSVVLRLTNLTSGPKMYVFLAFGVDCKIFVVFIFCRELKGIIGKFLPFHCYPFTPLFTNKGKTLSSKLLDWSN